MQNPKFLKMTEIWALIEGHEWTIEELIIWLDRMNNAIHEYATFQQIRGKSREDVVFALDLFNEFDELSARALNVFREVAKQPFPTPRMARIADIEKILNELKKLGLYPGQKTDILG